MPFHNIFSASKLDKPEEKIKIIIDIHEKNSLVASELVHLGFQIDFQHLQVADYLIGNIAIERKTLPDLQSSIIDRRIFTQLKEIKQYEKYLLLIEDSNISPEYRKINDNIIKGFILSSLLSLNIPIIFTQNEKDTAKYLSMIAKRQSSNKNHEFSLRPKKIAKTKDEQLQFILEGFPHIGPATAKALIKKFSSIKNIINADEVSLQKILGKNAKSFIEIINSYQDLNS